MKSSLHVWAAVAAVGVAVGTPALHADEGMWLYNAPPLKQLKEKYGFEPTKEWLDHLQKSSVRFNSGGSGSFVSPDGLVMTNHHVGADDLQKLSDIKKVDYLKLGFEAKTKAEELKCPDLELNVLQSIKDVTDEVKGAVTADMKPADAVKARQQKIEELQKGVADEKKGIRADVVTLFAGGAYHLYTFKKYTDIRLVFAPEKQAAFFGGDPDNFEFPRFDLDMCFFRVYEDDKPIKCEHYLKWSAAGAKEGELTFVSGHPGRTNRQNTVAELEYLRDVGYPSVLSRLARLEVLLGSWVARSEENRKKGEDDLFGIQNSRKARIGGLQGLLDPKLFGRKREEEKKLRAFIDTLPAAEKEAAVKAFDMIAASQKKRAEYLKDSVAYSFNSTAFGTAQTLLRYADEMKKDPKDRLPEFGETRIPSLKRSLLSPVPVEVDYETLKLADSLSLLASTYGADHELVKKVLAGKSPKERAYELVSGTKVTDPEFRKKCFEGKEAPDSDPMIALAKLVDEPSRAIRKKVETEVDEPKRQAGQVLAKARAAMDAGNTYPDATFTLRLSYGTVKGYKENGKDVPAFTTMAGLYERSKEQGNQGPFELPKRWEEKKQSLDLKTPYNFVSTADIIGGNSGSPVVNTAGEVVGLIFDGNIQSLVLDFIYDDTEARAVSVDSRAIIEGLRKVYDAARLAAFPPTTSHTTPLLSPPRGELAMRPVATLLAVALLAAAATAADVDVGAIDQKAVKKDDLAAPKKDDKPPAVELKGTLQAKVAKGEKRNVYFAVYPLGKDGKGTYWWVQGEVTKDGEAVTCDAQFGEEDAGSGEYFAVIAIATERKWSVGEKLDDLPADAAVSKVVVAKRK